MGHMHADLVRAPGFEPAFDQRGRAKILDNPDASDRMASACEQYGLTLPIRFVTGQHGRNFEDVAGLKAGAFNTAQPWVRGAGHPITQRKVAAVHGMFFELLGKPVVGSI